MASNKISRSSRVTKVPTLCRHCGKHASEPPAWLTLLEKMAPGTGCSEPGYTVSSLAKTSGLSRQRIALLVTACITEGVLEIPKDLHGAKVYRRTWYGRQLLGRWKTAGWKRDSSPTDNSKVRAAKGARPATNNISLKPRKVLIQNWKKLVAPLNCRFCGSLMQPYHPAPASDPTRGNMMSCPKCWAGCLWQPPDAWDWRPGFSKNRDKEG